MEAVVALSCLIELDMRCDTPEVASRFSNQMRRESQKTVHCNPSMHRVESLSGLRGEIADLTLQV